MTDSLQKTRPSDVLRFTIVSVAIVVSVIVVILAGIAGIKAFGRWQTRNDANNRVQVTHINIRNAQQQAKVVNAEIQATVAEASKRYQEAIGIRRAQDEISRTLTPLYIQHEAIQAQEAIANSGKNNTAIYIPSGTQGVPLVSTVPPK